MRDRSGMSVRPTTSESMLNPRAEIIPEILLSTPVPPAQRYARVTLLRLLGHRLHGQSCAGYRTAQHIVFCFDQNLHETSSIGTF
jgi:hypothetical protein